MSVDLHLHSTVSDGTVSPKELVARAAASGLRTIALADHDDASGIGEAREAARALGIALVPAIELTARVDPRPEGTVHILGFGIDPASEELCAVSRRNRIGKRAQIVSMVERLRARGIAIEDEEAGLDLPGDRYLGRNRIASALVARGLAKDRRRAFKRFLSPGREAYASPEVVSAEEAVSAIKAAGGIAVFAHPTADDLERHLGKLVKIGVEGIEVYRPHAQGQLLEKIERARERRSLLATGGSDWHGLYPSIPLGEWKMQEEKVRAFLDRLRP
ncbi:PHP domain-containing protein [bacterium]|nr:PHP domain-containing protein [bacterium]